MSRTGSSGVKHRGWLAAAALFSGAVAMVLLVNSCTTMDATSSAPRIEGANFVGDKACVECHGKITRVFPASPHARLRLEQAKLPGRNGCESCHGPGSLHIAAGGGRDKFIVNPRKEPQACLQCHQDVEAQFHFPQHHPVLEGRMNCVQCHDPHGQDIMKPAGGLAMARLNESCAQCHREQTKPVIFEHPALREGCVTCHSPHGSINAKLLTVRDSNMCLRCHAQTPSTISGQFFIGNIRHTDFIKYGTCWSAGCHTAVHGSNTQPFLLY